MTEDLRHSQRIVFGAFVPHSCRIIPSAAELMEARRHELTKGRVLGQLSKYEASWSRVLEESVSWFWENLSAGKISATWRQGFLELYRREVEESKLFVISIRLSILCSDQLATMKKDLTIDAIRGGISRSEASYGRIFSECLYFYEYSHEKMPKNWTARWLEKMRVVWDVSKEDKSTTPALSDAVRRRVTAAEAGEPPKKKPGRPRIGEKASPKGKNPKAPKGPKKP